MQISSTQQMVGDAPSFQEDARDNAPLSLPLDRGGRVERLVGPPSLYLRARIPVERLLVLLSLPLLLPLLAAIALLVRLDSPGPVLFRQRSCGRGGGTFVIVKFRTMRDDAGGGGFTMEEDARVTRCGRWLRAHRLDELPQLWNVLRGEMSLIGPRPDLPVYNQIFEREIAGYRRRLDVLPGLTGLAQVELGYIDSITGARERLALDLEYMATVSLRRDIAIICRTVVVMAGARGAR